MRLIRLKVRNIASLKGEHEIDFTEISRGSPLFAITGETGSGKSSILNSIGLALYGEIYKKNINQVDVVTLGEKDGAIELIFQVKGNYYLADWRARVLKQNGEPYSTPQSPVRTLYKLEGEHFHSPKTATTTTTTELLNLDFEQYCRCIILNQGEFAKFLNSTFKDRRDILEKLYPGEVLDNISKELDAEKKLLEKSKQEIDIQLDTLRGDKTSGDELKVLKTVLEEELKLLEKTFLHVESLNNHFISVFSYYEKFHANERNKDKIKDTLDTETSRYNLILKTGESLQERHLAAKKAQETELPLLETYLKKEETLKHLEEGWLNHKKKYSEIQNTLSHLTEKILSKEQILRDQKEKLVSIEFNMPLTELKNGRPYFEDLFDLFSETEILNEELKGKKDKLTTLEHSGKELKQLVTVIEEKLAFIPKDIEQQRKSLSDKIDKKQREDLKSQELLRLIENGKKIIEKTGSDQKVIKAEIQHKREALLPVETTLKLQEIFTAKEICVDHALMTKSDQCPVCEQNVSESIWGPLKEKLKLTDLASLRKRFDEESKMLQKIENDCEILERQMVAEKAELNKRESELNHIQISDLPSTEKLKAEFESIGKVAWEFETNSKDLLIKQAELAKFREQYLKVKNETTLLESSYKEKEARLLNLHTNLSVLLPSLNKDSVRDLKIEARKLNEYLELETSLGKTEQELIYLQEQKAQNLKEADNYRINEEQELAKIEVLKADLAKALNGEKASVLMARINQEARKAQEEWEKHLDIERKQANILKESQGRLHQLDELTKDFDLQFSKELHILKDKAKDHPVADLAFIESLDFDFKTPHELFVPVKDVLESKKSEFKVSSNECRMKLSAAQTRFTEWEKLQDKILLLELKAKDINTELSKKQRLFEVLGKDELRTFVLSLVEENLIQQTNEELQKLCQGRYEIVHQTKSMKMTPEFFILDKFREGGRRKVSTLSGGETFMVSLAMALGLAEMTRGQAEIDSLFIDEGFGTLDQDSLEDVLDMLQQIQNRGLMVGVISHIKTLTNALPVNLVLSKKQDGTSTTSIQFN